MCLLSAQGISLKAQLELQRQSYRKAARILTISPASPAPEGTNPSPGSTAPGQPSQQGGAKRITMLSNMGCVQHTLGKSNTAALCFAQALRTCAQTPVLEQVRASSCRNGLHTEWCMTTPLLGPPPPCFAFCPSLLFSSWHALLCPASL